MKSTRLRLDSPLAGGSTEIHLREHGDPAGPPLLLLHGGWGYAYYPWDVDALARFRVLAPDRTGFGRSARPVGERLPRGFHALAVEESLRLLDALGIERAALWGHSDGAVIALRMALAAPERFPRVVAEAAHFWKRKPGSRAFFAGGRTPEVLGPDAAARLQAEHGDDWRDLLRAAGDAWLALADEARAPDEDLYDGRLAALESDVLLLHGARDPRTEPGEFDALVRALPRAHVALLPEGGHTPHAEKRVRDEAHARAVAFLR